MLSRVGIILLMALVGISTGYAQNTQVAGASNTSRSIDTIPLFFRGNSQLTDPGRNLVTGSIIDNDQELLFLFNDSILVNNKTWLVAPKSQLSYSPRGIQSIQFSATRDSSKMAVTSVTPVYNSPINIELNQVQINDLASLFTKDTMQASGSVSGRIMAADFNQRLPALTGKSTLTNLTFKQQLIGNLQLDAERLNDSTIRTNILLEGVGNDIALKGNYSVMSEKQQLNLQADIKSFNLAPMQVWAQRYLNKITGHATGLINITGRLMKPEWKGTIKVDSTQFSFKPFGTIGYIDQQQFSLNFPGIFFQEFLIKDSLGNRVAVNGHVGTKNGGLDQMALDITAQNFLVLTAPKAIRNQMYGSAFISGKFSLTGEIKKPVIRGNIYLTDRTNLTLVLAEKNIEQDEAGTVVSFIDRDTFLMNQRSTFKPVVEPVIDFTKFINYGLNIHIDKKASLNIVIDPTTGDELKVYGAAILNAGTGPDSNLVLAGKYELDSGYYELSYQFLKKRFNLAKGSSIVFNGYPADAKLNITAEYMAITSPQELLGNEVGSVNPALAHSFRAQIPFKVMLSLKGSLKKPSIVFDIRLQADQPINNSLKRIIENKLVQLRSDVAAINKQVFALLVLERFVGEQSTDFFKGNATNTGFADIRGNSVSRFLADALDEIASDLFKGINVDLNLNSYQDFIVNDGPKNDDLGVSVSKNFLNDRLSVTVGKTFGIESQDGSAKAAQQKGSRFLPDVTINYKLSKDGKYMFRSYSKDQLEVILDGYVVETGLAFIIKMDYDKFRELFINKNKPRAFND